MTLIWLLVALSATASAVLFFFSRKKCTCAYVTDKIIRDVHCSRHGDLYEPTDRELG